MTPNELSIHAEVYREKQKMEQDEKITLVWMGEYFHRLEKLPPLKQFLEIEEKEEVKKEMTSDEMYKQVEKLNALFGGEVK